MVNETPLVPDLERLEEMIADGDGASPSRAEAGGDLRQDQKPISSAHRGKTEAVPFGRVGGAGVLPRQRYPKFGFRGTSRGAQPTAGGPENRQAPYKPESTFAKRHSIHRPPCCPHNNSSFRQLGASLRNGTTTLRNVHIHAARLPGTPRRAPRDARRSACSSFGQNPPAAMDRGVRKYVVR